MPFDTNILNNLNIDHKFLFNNSSLMKSSDPMCSVVEEEKFDCYPDAFATEEKCLNRRCCWNVKNNSSSNNYPPLNVPYCYYPSDYIGYRIIAIKKYESGISAILERVIPSGFPNDIAHVNITVFFYSQDIVRIKLTDVKNKRYEVPLSYPFLKKYHTEIHSSKKHFQFWKQYDVLLKMNGELSVIRKLSKQIIFHTNLSHLVYSDQFLQLSSRLPSHYIYGLGQHKAPLMRSTLWTRFTLFNRDRAPTENMNLYGSHPFYLALENDGKSHGVFLLNSNAMDIILQPTPAITFRPIGGILDFYIFLGPTPNNVISQYTSIIGRTFMPPYWSLGFHLCRYGYNTLNETRAVWNRTRKAQIPFDTQWNDIDYMINHNDFTYDKIRFKGLPEFVKELHRIGMHYIPIVDPGISNAEPSGTYPPFDDGLKMDIFVKNSTGQLFVGKVWNKVSTVFPDFTHPKAVNYWAQQFKRYYSEVEIDGAWIDMNEPSNFYNGQYNGCPNSKYEDPPYIPGGIEPLRTKTLCMTCKQYSTLHYNVHNLYGLTEAFATNRALRTLRNKRPFIISRSSYPGLGYYAGNWDGDISSTWDNMKWTIPSILNFNMFGISMVGADICGFNGNTTVELCARWSALGAFYPFSRNHNSDDSIAQDPVALGPEVVAAAKLSLIRRYFLLPYLYTLFYRSHMLGETVARPLFFEYPNDPNTYEIDWQFLWGEALMISPVLKQGATNITAYIPPDTWYDFYTGEKYPNIGTNITLNAPLDFINLAIRGGNILPAQLVAHTTTASRLNNFCLLVALNEDNNAKGELYWDDGDSLDSIDAHQYSLIYFDAFNNEIISSVNNKGYTDIPHIEYVTIMGCKFRPKVVTANDVSVPFTYDSHHNVLTISKLDLSLLKNNTIKWE